jgi:hypothetical protein
MIAGRNIFTHYLLLLTEVNFNREDDVEPEDNDNQIKLRRVKMRVSAPKRMANPFRRFHFNFPFLFFNFSPTYSSSTNSNGLTPSIVSSSLDWSSLFSDPALPVHLDVGCARGGCLLKLSSKEKRQKWNHLGVEIRPNVVAEAMEASSNSFPAF